MQLLGLKTSLFASALVLFMGCSSNDSAQSDGGKKKPDEQTPNAEKIMTVDETLGADAATFPPFASGTGVRHAATVVGPTGNRFRLIEKELLVATSDSAQLEGVLARTGGTLLETWDFSTAGDSSGLRFHAIQIDPSRTSADDLEQALSKIESLQGRIRVSSTAALATFAAYASEAKQGTHVFPNFLMDNTTIMDRVTQEGPGVTWFSSDYSRNPFEWPYMKRGGALDIGVAEAWRIVEANVPTGTRVPVVVLDGGFKNTGDLPADTQLAPSTTWDTPNPGQCCEGTCSCSWHGTGTARILAAKADDGAGSVGIGAPVIQPILAQSPANDFISYLHYLGDLDFGLRMARIINISASTTIDQWVCDASGFFMGPAGVCSVPHHLGAALRAVGYLLIASAGNDGSRDIDAEFGGFTIPCEMFGTVCVGGFDWNRPVRSPYSTWASRREQGGIDIWAPFDLWVGPDPTAPGAVDNEVISGTSVSAPFVSGVAALIEAVNPSMSADEIAHTLISTAHVGSSSQVHRWIDAYSAVKQAAGGKAPPFIRITRPIADSSDLHRPFDEPFQAEVTDADSDLTVTWADSVDGPLGTGISITHPSLSYGTHVITATATSRGVSHSTSITVTRTNVTPTMTILAPQAGTPLYTGQIISLLASSSDPNELGGTLSDSQVSWFAGTQLLGTGHARDIPGNTLAPGSYVLRVVGTDGIDSTEATKNIEVSAIPPIFPPSLARSARPTTRTSVMRTLI